RLGGNLEPLDEVLALFAVPVDERRDPVAGTLGDLENPLAVDVLWVEVGDVELAVGVDDDDPVVAAEHAERFAVALFIQSQADLVEPKLFGGQRRGADAAPDDLLDR